LLNNDLIEPSTSPWSSPVILVKKKDGTYRFCVDFRKLNAETVKDAYPIPCPEEQLDALVNARYFSSLDLASGFWQIPMDKNDQEKTAFVINNGLYQFKVMPMGLTNAPLTFEEHIERLEEVISILHDAGLKIKFSKCQFGLTEIVYLGHLINEHGIKPDPKKVEAIINVKEPTNVTEVRSFIGLCSYYRKFIPQFSKIAEPLLNLTRNNVSLIGILIVKMRLRA